jgi:hypothetical protein
VSRNEPGRKGIDEEETLHTTNYFDAFIEIADDSPVAVSQIPPVKGDKKTVANAQFEMIAGAPYRFTSDDVIFTVYADRAGISDAERAAERERFFSRGQACLRASPLAKRYGWGTHSDADGKVALVPAGSDEYRRLAEDPSVRHVKAIRSRRG